MADYCPVIFRNTMVKNSTSINSIWQAIRLHYVYQSTGAHYLDFNNIKLEADEPPEDLYQPHMSFIEENLLVANGTITHHGETPSTDDKMSVTLENLVVLTWLRLIHADLPSLVKQHSRPSSGAGPSRLLSLKSPKIWSHSWKKYVPQLTLTSCLLRSPNWDHLLKKLLTTHPNSPSLNVRSSLAPYTNRLVVSISWQCIRRKGTSH